ncbi:bifunctional hydroxymethylpyrimidine kinase/phosphomethylpyrimidine kinase [Leeia oryzae]|uniref:bifunctional hydroxymethylpyrimidine kinase/phosphomethylpyrimidine kinase n=1 Tax=Leeia oryzae TaxID=356662 RepID=UPI00037865D2|nr:bifunctional hydroxymethylpyrimidine kinase/phosphomethylpyrimidine kinase [Leeia oryzae]
MKQREFARVLSIAGSDPSGGAGLQADLRTIAQLGGYGMAVPTALTVQNSKGVSAVYPVDVAQLEAQIDALCEDTPPHATKLGMLVDAARVRLIHHCIQRWQLPNVVCDPVMISTSGKALLDEAGVQALLQMLPILTLITPNVPEATCLTGLPVTDTASAAAAGQQLIRQGANAVLVKGGHVTGQQMTDVLCMRGAPSPLYFTGPVIHSQNTHGTGCTLSSAIATALARGFPLTEAVRVGKDYLQQGLQDSVGIWNGSGQGGFMSCPAALK